MLVSKGEEKILEADDIIGALLVVVCGGAITELSTSCDTEHHVLGFASASSPRFILFYFLK